MAEAKALAQLAHAEEYMRYMTALYREGRTVDRV